MLPPLNMTNDGGSSPQLSPAQKRAQSLENRNSIDVLNKSPQLVEMDHLKKKALKLRQNDKRKDDSCKRRLKFDL